MVCTCRPTRRYYAGEKHRIRDTDNIHLDGLWEIPTGTLGQDADIGLGLRAFKLTFRV